MSWVAPLLLLLTSLVDLVLVVLYQKCFHPWRRILAGKEYVEGEEKDPTYRRMTSTEQYQMTKESVSGSV